MRYLEKTQEWRPSLRAGPTVWIPPQPRSCTKRYTSATSVARGAQRPSPKNQNDTKRRETAKIRIPPAWRNPARGSRGIEYRTAADIAVGAAIKHGLALRAATEHANKAATVFKLIEQRRRDHLGRSLQQDHVIRPLARAALGQRPCHNLGVRQPAFAACRASAASSSRPTTEPARWVSSAVE